MTVKLVKVETDKNRYVAGESIHIAGMAEGIAPGKPIDIQIYDPYSNSKISKIGRHRNHYEQKLFSYLVFLLFIRSSTKSNGLASSMTA